MHHIFSVGTAVEGTDRLGGHKAFSCRSLVVGMNEVVLHVDLSTQTATLEILALFDLALCLYYKY